MAKRKWNSLIPRFERTSWCGDGVGDGWYEGSCYVATWFGRCVQISFGKREGWGGKA